MLLLCSVIFFVSSAAAHALHPITGPVQVGQLKMSPIGGGTWAWGNQFLWKYDESDDEVLQQAYNYAVQNGINWFDTADSYGTGKLTGRSESLLGIFNAEKRSASGGRANGNKNAYFCTKLAPFPWRLTKTSVLNTFAGSKMRMRKPVVDMIQLHWPPALSFQESAFVSAFSEIARSGETTQIGLSNFGPKGLRRISETFAEKGNRVYSNQVQFSLLSRYPLTSGLTDVCEELGVQPIAYSPLALGLLTDKYTIDRLPKGGPRSLLFREYLPSMTPLLSTLREIAKARRKTVSQVALNWNLQKGFLVLVGVRSIDQVKENLGAVGWALTSAEVEELERSAKKVPKQLVQNPNQCP